MPATTIIHVFATLALLIALMVSVTRSDAAVRVQPRCERGPATIVLARFTLNERVSRIQLLGRGLALVASVMLALS
ncbi:hypothetical protein ADILRU_0826 [Leifsonia rubra CMS 76R]|nr:hypothetical protein ADILRU_0826 [Leifsonia rubra CMS 76R]